MTERLAALSKELEHARRYNNSWTSEEKEILLNDFTFHSTKIEGLNMTYGDTIQFLKTGLVRETFKIKDITDLTNHKSILNTVFNTYDSIRIDNNQIRAIHAELMKDPQQWETNDWLSITPGKFKEGVNYGYRGNGKYKEYMLSAFVGPNLEAASKLYYLQCADKTIHPIEAIAQFHYTFLNEIHPFDDGNGRVARLLMVVQQLQHGLPIAYPKAENKTKYIEAIIRSEQTKDIKNLVNFFVDLTMESISEKKENNQKLPFHKKP